MTETLVDDATHARITAAADEIIARGETARRDARDPVNQPTINNWLEAIGLDNPRFRNGEAPPSMAQVWTMYGLGGRAPADDPLHGIMRIFDELGFRGVLATNCEQIYDRYLDVGEQVHVTTALESVVGPKTTAMGVGYFVTSRNNWYVARSDGSTERVATMLFRVLKFIPKGAAS